MKWSSTLDCLGTSSNSVRTSFIEGQLSLGVPAWANNIFAMFSFRIGNQPSLVSIISLERGKQMADLDMIYQEENQIQLGGYKPKKSIVNRRTAFC